MDAGGGNSRRIAAGVPFSAHGACGQKWADDRTVVLPGRRDGRPGMRLIDVPEASEGQMAKGSPQVMRPMSQ